MEVTRDGLVPERTPSWLWDPGFRGGLTRIDLLKLLLALAWDIKAMDSRKYGHLSEHIAEIGRMLGGWRRQMIQKTPRSESGEKRNS